MHVSRSSTPVHCCKLQHSEPLVTEFYTAVLDATIMVMAMVINNDTNDIIMAKA